MEQVRIPILPTWPEQCEWCGGEVEIVRRKQRPIDDESAYRVHCVVCLKSYFRPERSVDYLTDYKISRVLRGRHSSKVQKYQYGTSMGKTRIPMK